MPFLVEETNHGFRVSSPSGVKAKGTTKTKAKKQIRLLQAIEHNPDFKPHKRKGFGLNP